MKFSIAIPAHNEEAYIGACLDSIEAAARPYPGQVEVIVALNRCTDRTEEIVRARGALIVREESKNLSRIRNAAARFARGEILVMIDADSTMTPNMLTEIDRSLSAGKCIGGGVAIRMERMSLGILLTLFMLAPVLLYHRVSGGLFWCYRRDFEEIDGFDERLVSAEDLDFAKRLKAYGKTQGKCFKTLRKAYIQTSTRKFDQLGDWYLVRHPRLMWTILKGKNRQAANDFYYDVMR